MCGSNWSPSSLNCQYALRVFYSSALLPLKLSAGFIAGVSAAHRPAIITAVVESDTNTLISCLLEPELL